MLSVAETPPNYQQVMINEILRQAQFDYFSDFNTVPKNGVALYLTGAGIRNLVHGDGFHYQ